MLRSSNMAAPFANAAPTSKLVLEKSSFTHQKNTHERVLDSKYFTYNATIILPYNGITARLPSQISEIQQQQMSHLVHHAPLHQLLGKEFIEAFVKRGQLHILSHKTHIDTQNCVALLPTGHLILHVTKDTYEQLGLEGKPSAFSFHKPTKYVVDIDLKPNSFTPGRKGYDRVLWCLKDRLDLVFNLLVSWTPHDEKICQSSVSTFFESKGLLVSPVPWCVRTQWLNNVRTPVLDSNATVATEQSCGREELWEWLGALACGIDMSESSPDSYLSTLSCPSPNVKCMRCCVLSVSGFLTPTATKWLFNKVRCEVESKQAADTSTWGSLTLHGFLDSPVSVGSREHGFFQEGDNLHSFVVFSDKDYWLYSVYGQHDFCQ